MVSFVRDSKPLAGRPGPALRCTENVASTRELLVEWTLSLDCSCNLATITPNRPKGVQWAPTGFADNSLNLFGFSWNGRVSDGI